MCGETGVQGHFGWKMKRRLIIVLWLTCYLPVLLTFFCPRLEEELSRDFVISPLKLKFRLLLNYYFIIHANSFKIWWCKRRLLNQISNLMTITISSSSPCMLMFCSPPALSRTVFMFHPSSNYSSHPDCDSDWDGRTQPPTHIGYIEHTIRSQKIAKKGISAQNFKWNMGELVPFSGTW